MAKIYDGLYYPFTSSMCSEPEDVCIDADGDYSREAAAYEQLTAAKLTGDFAPKYYGAWTMHLPLRIDSDRPYAGDHVRPVRLILMEAIHGPSMRDMFTRNSPYAGAGPDAYHYSEDYRLDVMARILDGETRQFHAGVRQHDLYPRNIILAESPEARAGTNTTETRCRVVLVDYNRALVFQRTIRGLTRAQRKPRPQNPLERHKRNPLLVFAGWVPESWHYEIEEADRVRLRWFEETFCGEKAALYEPIDTEDDSD